MARSYGMVLSPSVARSGTVVLSRPLARSAVMVLSARMAAAALRRGRNVLRLARLAADQSQRPAVPLHGRKERLPLPRAEGELRQPLAAPAGVVQAVQAVGNVRPVPA